MQVWLAVYGLHWVPLPRSTSSPPDKFAEDRALEHATHLSENIGNRIVRPSARSPLTLRHVEAQRASK